jgi:hypothetical protein
MNLETLEAIRSVIAYLEYDEAKDYRSRSSKERQGHIYKSVMTIRDWLKAEPDAAS